MKKIINFVLIVIILITASISGYRHQQDINDVAYVIAMRN